MKKPNTKTQGMKILLLDLETAPNLAYVWDLWQKGINIDWIESSGYILCYAAKWYGEDEILFDSVKKSKPKKMLKGIHKLLTEADAVISYNGLKFDHPTLNKEFLQHNMGPPEPYRIIDLYLVVRSTFRFTSNKLAYVAKALGLQGKVKHRGPQLWLDCMAGKKTAWAEMEEYNVGDIVTLEEVYEELLPWIRQHPNHALYTDETRPVCVNCGSAHVVRKGKTRTLARIYQQYKCKGCGKWMRERLSEKLGDKKVLAGAR